MSTWVIDKLEDALNIPIKGGDTIFFIDEEWIRRLNPPTRDNSRVSSVPFAYRPGTEAASCRSETGAAADRGPKTGLHKSELRSVGNTDPNAS